MSFTCRNAQAADSAAVSQIVRAVLTEYGLQFDAAGTDADLADLDASYLRRGGEFRILQSADGSIVGCGGLYRIDAETVELRKMYLLPEARGRGLGKHLLSDLLADARRLGYSRVVLETNSVLKEAIALYKGFGFVPVQREHCARRCDQAWELSLSPQDVA
jgi:putative acetyltransferase